MKKYAIMILSDLSNGSEESLGRVLNGLVLANDLKTRKIEFLILFQGAGTRSINILEDQAHPGHALYKNVKPQIQGASKACSIVFKANITTVPLLNEFDIPGIGGATSIAKYMLEQYDVVSF